MEDILAEAGRPPLTDDLPATELPPQSKSLEFTRFTKAWHLTHPGKSATDGPLAWERYRSLPVDEPPPVDEI